MSHLRIFESPKSALLPAAPDLTLTGTLGDYTSELAYSDRLQIGDQIGACSAWLEAGTLPPGHLITVDGDEVVIAWPAYAAAVDAVPNGDLEDGDTGWVLGLGLAIGEWTYEYGGAENDEQAYDGTFAIEYGGGYRGNARAVSTLRRPCVEGEEVTATCQVQQGPSESRHTSGWVLLIFYDADGAELQVVEGNHIESGSDAVWNLSTATAEAPANTAYASVGGECHRNREAKPMWLDAFELDLEATGSVGTNGFATFAITVGVRDAAGRVAYWTGTIEEVSSLHYEAFVGQNSILGYGVSLIDQDTLTITDQLAATTRVAFPKLSDDGLKIYGMGQLYPTEVVIATGVATALTGASSQGEVVVNATHLFALKFSPEALHKLLLADGSLVTTYTPSVECGGLAWNADKSLIYMARYGGRGFTTLEVATGTLTDYATGVTSINQGRGIDVRTSDEDVFSTGQNSATNTFRLVHFDSAGTLLGYAVTPQECQRPRINPAGTECWVVNYDQVIGKVYVYDITGDTPVLDATITVGNNPNWIEFSSDGRFAYVTCGVSDETIIIDCGPRTILDSIDTPEFPAGVVVVAT